MIDDLFDRYLSDLDRAEKAKNARELTTALSQYNYWAAHFELLKIRFQELWDFFGKVSTVTNWERPNNENPCDGSQKYHDFFGTGYYACCYSFRASIQNTSGKKLLVNTVDMDWLKTLHETSAGIGDERYLVERRDFLYLEPCPVKLYGLNRILEAEPDADASRAIDLFNRLDTVGIGFRILMPDRTQSGHKVVPLSLLYHNSLVDVCKLIIIAMNMDIVNNDTYPSGYYPLPSNVKNLMDGNNKK